MKLRRGICGAAALALCLHFGALQSHAEQTSENNCPAAFEVVDLGKWVDDNAGGKKLDYGGLLYHLKSPSRDHAHGAKDLVICISPDKLGGRRQLLDGLPVPLVTQLSDGDLGWHFVRRPSGDYVGIQATGVIFQMESAERAFEAVEAKRRADFTGWAATAAKRDQALEEGPGYTCLFKAANPTLEGYGNYTCIATIEGMPNHDTYFRCSKWGGSCFADYSLPEGVKIRIQAESLRHWKEAARMRSIPDAVSFWSPFILTSVDNFYSAIIPRTSDVLITLED